MSYYRPLRNNESDRSRDPRHRDRSRSEIRRPNTPDTFSPPLVTNEPLRQEESTPRNGVLDFLKTLGLNAQLIQALVNANPPKLEQIQQPPLQQSVNNAQEFASFLSKSYGLDPTVVPTTNQSVSRDPRRRQISTVPISVTNDSLHKMPINISTRFDRPTDPRSAARSTSMITNNNNSSSSISIDESFKQYLSSIDQSILDDDTRKRLQRIALLDNELDKLHRMNIELIKNSERRSRRRTSTKDKDPLLKENEILQNELIDYIKTLKTTILMINYPLYMFRHNTINGRQ